jgi:2-polyprenyl-3-methyl-5-hydroxy-6-metoxy-1,4-benzoquinol methylase
MNRREFLSSCKLVAADVQHQDVEYLRYHEHRLYATYALCRSLLPAGGRLLSLGAGGAYVETALARTVGARVTVVDLPEAIERNKAYYERAGFTTVPADISRDHLELVDEAADLLLSAEIIEHLPIAPSVHLGRATPYLGPGRWCVITTPNLGAARNIAKLVCLRPLLPPAEVVFAPTSFATEGVHRREYLASEIRAAMQTAGIDAKLMRYDWYHLPRTTTERILFAAEAGVPRLRPMILAAGQKRPSRAGP